MTPSRFSDNDQPLFQSGVLPFRPCELFHAAVFCVVLAHTFLLAIVRASYLALQQGIVSKQLACQSLPDTSLPKPPVTSPGIFRYNLSAWNKCIGVRVNCRSCRYL